MAKKADINQSELFHPKESEAFRARQARRRRALVIPRLLTEEAEKVIYRGPAQERAFEILTHWADLETQGHLKKKETSLDAEFLTQVFGEALGYRPATVSPDQYELQREFYVPGVGPADGALGNFSPGNTDQPLVVIELKGWDVNLDRDRATRGLTPVEQCWGYLDNVAGCQWGIVSNFVTIRLYHRDKTRQAYEEFTLQDLRNLRRFREFYYLMEVGGLVRPKNQQPLRARWLIERSENRQREVGDSLYEKYSEQRHRLIQHLIEGGQRSRDQSISIAQKILDRIIFVAFCEDRGLLPEKCIEQTHESIPPITKVTNPRWRNFLQLFQGVDGEYNGGLFAYDEAVDNLQLDDSWTHFFKDIGNYDFRTEVNVDVLGHLFERSINELEKLRTTGLFGIDGIKSGTTRAVSVMPKSAERKRFGTYYTPAEFTKFIVKQTLGRMIDERFEALRIKHGLEPAQLQPGQFAPQAAGYWRECLDTLRAIKVCDPACGSGAFLIQAYAEFDDRYQPVVEQVILYEGHTADPLEDAIPDMILHENLFGADLSREAVEITQLALWVRSARRGKTLADLSSNIVWGNSLVSDPAVIQQSHQTSDKSKHPKAMLWDVIFPAVFDRPERGFDCVIGNPPWERMKLQEREFFSFSAPEIAGAVSAAQRRSLIAALETQNPDLYATYVRAQNAADAALNHVRTCGRFPLTGKGDINTYAIFAELARSLVAPHGCVGVLVPSGIATDTTTKEFFSELMESQALKSLFDFENKAPIFADVHRSYKFCILLLGGSAVKTASADFTFFGHSMDDLDEKDRHISLSSADLKLLNPNTRTCPIFRSRRDATLTKAIYRRVPILIDENRKKGGNPWGIKFTTMFHQTNDAELFHAPEQLKEQSFKLHGNRWTKGKRTFLPLYEAKMFRPYDHRYGSVFIDSKNWVNQGQTVETTLVQHQNPEFVVQPRWWVAEENVLAAIQNVATPAFLAFRDITRTTDTRTTLASFIPFCGAINTAPIMLFDQSISARQQCCLLANMNSFALDYVARQKIGGIHLNYFILNQLPFFTPDRYSDKCPWDKRQSLERWISERALKLTCTAEDMQPLAEAAGFDPPVHSWKPEERARLLAELDAAYFLLYGLKRDDVEYILSTFARTRQPDESTGHLVQTDTAILESYDRLSERINSTRPSED